MTTSTSRRRGTTQRNPRTASEATDPAATDPADVEVTGTGVTGTVSGGAGPVGDEEVDVTAIVDGWADVVPLIALRSGSRPTGAEVRFALPVWAELTGGGDPRTAMQVGAAVELAGYPGVDGADVKRILNRFERAGIAVLDSGGPVPRWLAADPGDIVRDAIRTPHGDSVNGGEGARAGAGSSGRMVAGGLRGSVEDFLAEHPGEEFGAAAIAGELGRSSGAVANALAKLVETGAVDQTGAAPLRYRHRPEETATTGPGADDVTNTNTGTDVTGDGAGGADPATPDSGERDADAL